MSSLIDHKFKKNLGQVFLKNKNIKQKIANLVNTSEHDEVLEIGPGSGALTEFIDLEKKKYFAIEIDKDLSRHLGYEFPKAEIICADFLDIDVDQIVSSNKALLFGNIPYYISTKIIIKFLTLKKFSTFYVMVQKEYFDMLKAEFNTKTYSSFSVLVQSSCTAYKLININRMNFFPKPKIDSVFLKLQKIDNFLDENLEEFSFFLRICFSFPRKTLFNNLKNKIENIDLINAIYKQFSLKESIRSQEISPKLFKEIFLSDPCKSFFKNSYKVD